jgi:hypothetical protein
MSKERVSIRKYKRAIKQSKNLYRYPKGVIRRAGTKFICSVLSGVEVLSMMSTKRGIVMSTNKGGYLLDKKNKLRKLKV